MIDEKLKYYKEIEKDYDLDKLNIKGVELFEIVNKYQFYGKKVKGIYLKILYKLGYLIALHLAKKESTGALKNKNKV